MASAIVTSDMFLATCHDGLFFSVKYGNIFTQFVNISTHIKEVHRQLYIAKVLLKSIFTHCNSNKNLSITMLSFL